MSENKGIELIIVTPKGETLHKYEVTQINLQTVEGELGILEGHTPLLGALKPGILTYVTDSQKGYKAVGTGFVEVEPNKTVLLVNESKEQSEINEDEVNNQLNDIEKELEKVEHRLDSTLYQELLNRKEWFLTQLKFKKLEN